MRTFKNYLFLFVFFLFIPNEGNAQSRKFDSLLVVLKTAKEDTNKVISLFAIARLSSASGDYQKAKEFVTEAKILSDKLNYKKGLGNAENKLGNIDLQLVNYPGALSHFHSALKIKQEQKEKRGIAAVLGNIGIVYYERGDFPKALEYYFKALRIAEELEDKGAQAKQLGNIGLVYQGQQDHKTAMAFFVKEKKKYEELGKKEDVGLAIEHMAVSCYHSKNYSLALQHHFEALKLAELGNDLNGIANCYANIAVVYSEQKKYDAALEFYFKALEKDQQLGSKNRFAIDLGNIGRVYIETKNFSKARLYLNRAVSLCDSLGMSSHRMYAENSLHELYLAMGKPELSLEHYKKYILLKDSISNDLNTKKTVEVAMQYQFDKKTTADSIKNAEQMKVETLKHDLEIKQQRTYTYGGIIGFLLMLGVAGVSFRAFRQKQKTNSIISRQKELVEEKQKEILDSIQYARRIQRSLLPTEKYIQKSLIRLRNK